MLSLNPLDDLTICLCLAENKPLADSLLQRWNEDIDIDTMSYGILRLVPLILHQITRFDLKSPHEKRLKVIYKFWWVAYQHRSNQLQQVHTLLSEQGIPMMIIKGCGLIDYYENPIHRPMADIDILIPARDHAKALALLLNNHWVLEYPDSYKGNLFTTMLGLEAPHGIGLVNAVTDTKLDLHRRIGSDVSNQVSDWVWSSTVPSVSFPTLSKPAVHLELLMIVIHAVMSNFNDNLNWLVDLAHLQKHLTEEDWERALEAAMAEKKADIFLFGCHLAKQYGISIPAWLPEAEAPNLNRSNAPVKKPSLAWIKRVNSAIYSTIDHRHPNRARPLKWAMHAYNFAVRGLMFLGRRIRGRKHSNTGA